MEHYEQVDLPGEIYDGYEEEQALIRALFDRPFPSIAAIKAVIQSRKFDFQTMLTKYKSELKSWIDNDCIDLLKFLDDGAYLQSLWVEISKPGYQKWFYKYLEHRDRLKEIVEYYQTAEDFSYGFVQLARDAKNELYLAQTQPGEPEDLDVDGYLNGYSFIEEIKSTMNGNAKSSVDTPNFEKLKGSFNKSWNPDFLNSKPAAVIRETSPAYTAVDPTTKEVYEKRYEIIEKLEDITPTAQVQVEFYEDPKTVYSPNPKRYRRRQFPNRIGRVKTPIEISYQIPYKWVELSDKGEDDPDVFLSLSDDFKTLFDSDNMPDNSDDYERIPDDFDDSLFDDRGVGSVAIKYAETEEFKPREYQSLRFSDIGKIINTVKRIAFKYKRRNFMVRKHFWELGVFPDYPRLRYCKDKAQWKKFGIKQKPEYLDEFMLEDLLIEKIPTVLETITRKFNEMLRDGIAKQDVALLLLDGIYIDFLAKDIRIPESGETLEEFISYAGDEILDFAYAMQDAPGWRDANEDYYAYLIDKVDLLKDMPYSDEKLEHSEMFNEVVIEHLFNGASVKDAYKNAHHHCKMQESALGAYAYRLARFFGKSHSHAMREFYQVAQDVGDLEKPRDKIVEVHDDHIIVLTAISGYDKERVINAKVTAIKARNSELFIPADADMTLKRRLMQFLKPFQLSPQVLATIKE